ncbi:galactose-3-O-sulfotransferase 2 [Microcaecilia unicolor]|uniref:Galactose-3-O-sulfotransferase 2 n=1 Tax=Microcaecilia unicolor TaxID=1415580 RepID=A0A6P7Z102_9AMPH|nr:galactose-3-O-sulfotransferase 2 [Microcaecilia unicolor]
MSLCHFKAIRDRMKFLQWKHRFSLTSTTHVALFLGFTLLLIFIRENNMHLADYIRMYNIFSYPDATMTPCRPVSNVMFLKTHKTGSSVILNILFRFAENNNLTVALPAGKTFHLGHPGPFKAQQVEGFSTMAHKYNIMCNHLRFNFSEVAKVMPNNTFYFSVLRNPTTLLESSFAYHKGSIPAFQKLTDLNEFLASPWTYYNLSVPIKNIHARNTMWYDFGYDNNAEEGENYVHSVLMDIEEKFQLVLITEYFDESMVLLKNILCWNLEDVVYFKLNFRTQESIQNLTHENKERVKEWCSLDWKLYKHFNRTFWKRIQETIGMEKMQKEVELLRSRQKELTEICVQNGKPMHKSQIKDKHLKPYQSGTADIMGYGLKSGLANETMRICHRLIVPETQHTALLYAKQFPEKPRKLDLTM